MCKLKFLLLLLFLCSCSLLRSYDERTFSFSYAGDTYQIVSKIQGDEVLNNVLQMYNTNGVPVLKAMDNDSDGDIDEILSGDISLSEANRIYYVGIEQALESGNLDSKNDVRIFEVIEPPYTYSIETFGYDDYTSRNRMVYGYLKEVVVYNQLTIIQTEEGTEKILRDMDADGKLDLAIEPKDSNLQEHQAVYEDIIDKGIKDGRISLTQEMYIVLPVEY